jgi:hypothetical protein
MRSTNASDSRVKDDPELQTRRLQNLFIKTPTNEISIHNNTKRMLYVAVTDDPNARITTDTTASTGVGGGFKTDGVAFNFGKNKKTGTAFANANIARQTVSVDAKSYFRVTGDCGLVWISDTIDFPCHRTPYQSLRIEKGQVKTVHEQKFTELGLEIPNLGHQKFQSTPRIDPGVIESVEGTSQSQCSSTEDMIQFEMDAPENDDEKLTNIESQQELSAGSNSSTPNFCRQPIPPQSVPGRASFCSEPDCAKSPSFFSIASTVSAASSGPVFDKSSAYADSTRERTLVGWSGAFSPSSPSTPAPPSGSFSCPLPTPSLPACVLPPPTRPDPWASQLPPTRPPPPLPAPFLPRAADPRPYSGDSGSRSSPTLADRILGRCFSLGGRRL